MVDEIKERTVYVLTRKNKADDDDTDIYVGSTSLPLWKRSCCHKQRAKNFIEIGCSKNNRLYVRMNEIGLENWEILPLLARTCSKKEICEVEKNWVRILMADLNTYSPITNKKEYQAACYENNKDAIKAYYEKNKDAIKEYKAKYRGNNKDAIKEYKAKYRKKNKEVKRYYCEICGVACKDNYNLKKQFDTLKHSYAWLDSLD